MQESNQIHSPYLPPLNTTKPNPMTPETPLTLTEQKDASFLNDTRIANHRLAAQYLESAAKFHTMAADFYQAGDHVNGAESSLKAQGFMHMAFEEQAANAKYYALHC